MGEQGFTTSAYDSGFFETGDGHRLYYERHGNPQGQPVIYLHGGPGSGCNFSEQFLFDLDHYNILLFDQRGSGHSQPYAETRLNSLPDLVGDIEKMRQFFGMGKPAIAGGSFGSALAMLYAARHPQNISRLLLWGVFFADRAGAVHITEKEGYAAQKRSAYFDQYQALIPQAERQDGLMLPYYKRLMSDDPALVREAARRFIRWDMSISTPEPRKQFLRRIGKSFPVNTSLARLWFHFAVHHFQDKNRDELLAAMARADFPVDILHGKKDHICPVENAILLHRQCKNGTLKILEDCGHWGADLQEAFVNVTARWATEDREGKKRRDFRPPSPSL